MLIYDGCRSYVHISCTGLSAAEAEFMSSKGRSLKFMRKACNLVLKDLPILINLIMEVKNEIASLKKQQNFDDVMGSEHTFGCVTFNMALNRFSCLRYLAYNAKLKLLDNYANFLRIHLNTYKSELLDIQ
ncbi:hypothetical protein O3M35_000501 [Rhynocoris fuscipes]|uniref:Uncharacterized protein n=1 Tax=Rhynocoris fuscipes TaxID=488301 RepID=A0AAW1DST5_9HEMI